MLWEMEQKCDWLKLITFIQMKYYSTVLFRTSRENTQTFFSQHLSISIIFDSLCCVCALATVPLYRQLVAQAF